MAQPIEINHKRLLNHVYWLATLLLVSLSSIVLLLHLYNHNKQQHIENHINYHMASINQLELLEKQVSILRGNTRVEAAQVNNNSVTRSHRNAEYKLLEHYNNVVDIQMRHGLDLFAPAMGSLMSSMQKIENEDIETPSSTERTLDRMAAHGDELLVNIEQLKSMHRVLGERLLAKQVRQDRHFLYGVIAYIVIVVIVTFLLARNNIRAIREILMEREALADQLNHEKELGEVTLASIGDAVIRTDDEGFINYLNPVAEELTGWTLHDAHGLKLATVFNVVNEITGEPLEDIAGRVIREDRIIELANHTVLISRDEKRISIEDTAAPVRSFRGDILGVVVVFHDVTDQRQIKAELQWQASHDALTELLNRSSFENKMVSILADGSLSRVHQHTLLYLDLDQFKLVNDTIGHLAGDELLKQAANVIREQVRETDVIARLGGDEFAIILPSCPQSRSLEVAEKVRQAICDHRFFWDNQVFTIGVSIGLVPFPLAGHANNVTDILRAADMACYEAKDQGRNRIFNYSTQDQELNLRETEMRRVTDLKEALAADRFRLYYQPIIELSQDEPQQERFEILTRMLDSNDEEIAPMGFIPAAERYDLIYSIDAWVIRQTLSELRHMDLSHIEFVTINLSGQSLNQDSLVTDILNALQIAELANDKICFEITETAAIRNLVKAQKVISALRDAGCRFALDDFGAGMSSFGYLKNLDVNFIKIDGHFIRYLAEDTVSHEIVQSINNIAHSLGIQTIAECVEDVATREMLNAMRIDYAQGFGIQRPQPLSERLASG